MRHEGDTNPHTATGAYHPGRVTTSANYGVSAGAPDVKTDTNPIMSTTPRPKNYKGDRDRHTLRLPVDFSAAVRRLAKAEGLPVNDYIGRKLSCVIGVPYEDETPALKAS